MQPMLATPGALPTGPGWVYEVKWDGMRLLADVRDGLVRLLTRGGRDVAGSFPELARLDAVAPDLLLDGEVVLLDRGVPSFTALTERIHGAVSPARAAARPVTFMVSDVLRLYGVDLTARPLEERRGTLERLDLTRVPAVSLSPSYTDGSALLAATAQRGMEGIVAKRADSPYTPGRRTAWIEVTHRLTRTCVVGGWRPERSNPTRIAALLVGVPGRDGLRFAGRVTAGLAGDAVQRILHGALDGLTTVAPPFDEPLPRVDGAGARWCEPLVVAEVAHAGTEGGRLLRPEFRGLRDDLDPADVDPFPAPAG
ncbi:ATP dependent DNA ligase [Pseudonocardia dioxanivorans CB1190]|uniref:DNA ligase (ATP) n=2 Tax=Pseudonocardia dioxanivorans TaxID=240495 RepID=F4CQK3_PSEUX|nr:ATP dependent DNA ligase [Pseudonocardia dioxanivorans CB1190]